LNPELRSTLLKVAAPLLAIVIVLAVTKLRGISWRGVVGLRLPRARQFVLWMLLWIVWVAVEEVAIRLLHLDQAHPWPQTDPLIIALRIAAIGILGPVAEELVCRGLLLGRLMATRLGVYGSVALIAAGWALVHVQYGWPTLLMIFLDGLLLGVARVRSRSLYVPIAMHMSGNLFSIYQSLSG
jgi:membrane protease YdiL (CAAX protease family)